jgi:hypothetical protein
MLSKLTDEVVSERLSQDAIDSAAYWRSWVRIIESGCKWLDKVKFGIKAKGMLEIERKGLCGDSSPS